LERREEELAAAQSQLAAAQSQLEQHRLKAALLALRCQRSPGDEKLKAKLEEEQVRRASAERGVAAAEAFLRASREDFDFERALAACKDDDERRAMLKSRLHPRGALVCGGVEGLLSRGVVVLV